MVPQLRDLSCRPALREKQRRHAAVVKDWNPSDKPDWLTEEVYLEKIQPRLRGVTIPAISSGLGVSELTRGKFAPGDTYRILD